MMPGSTADFYAKDYTKKHPGLTLAEAKKIGDEIGIDWDIVDLGEFIQGIKEEMEHGSEYGSSTQVHDDSFTTSGRIAYAHMIEIPNYYTLLEEMETKGEEMLPGDNAKKAWVAEQRQRFAKEWEEASQAVKGLDK
jgi:hypothetical protein